MHVSVFFKKPRRQVKRLEAKQLPQEEAQRIKKNRTEATTLAIVLLALHLRLLTSNNGGGTDCSSYR